MPIVYYPCLTLGQAWNLIENLSAFLKYRHMEYRNKIQGTKRLVGTGRIYRDKL